MKITHFVALGIIAAGLTATPSAEAGWWFWHKRPVTVVEPAPAVVVRPAPVVVVKPAPVVVAKPAPVVVVPQKRVWVEGHYAVRRGVRVWVPGEYVVVRP